MRWIVSLAISALVLLAGAGLALGQGVVVEPEASWTKPEELQAVITPATALGVDKGEGGIVALDPLDIEALLIEDEKDQSEGDKPLRIGVHRQLPALSPQDWLVVATEDGYIIRLVIHAPGALMIRPHFARFPAIEEASVYCYGRDVDLAEGPVRKNSAVKSLDFWGPPMVGENYYIECVYPAKPTADQYPLIDKISHIYRDAFDLGLEDKEGSCHNDVMCAEASQRDLASGVAAIAAETSSATSFCTGCLLADEVAATQVPYFLTANHCEVTSANAASTYFYFRFQTSTCNGSPPSMRSTPRTDGATHLVSYEPSDATLLKLAENPPASSTLAGYKTETIGPDVATTCIHHPYGTYKRITYGYTRSWGGHYGYDEANHITSQWTSGTTEPGSSGSPLFDGVYLIGQLHGGPGACDAGDYNFDYFGRFSVSYTGGLSVYLTGQAVPEEGDLVTVISQGLILAYHETQTYSVAIPAGATNLTAAITDVSGDADLYTRYAAEPSTSLYDCRPYSVADVDETCSHDNPTPGTWYIMVRGYSAASCNLTVTYTVPSSDGEDAREAVEALVTLFYQQCLGREPEQTGLDDWVNQLMAGTRTGAEVARGFILSAEFIERDASDQEYVTILYRAFFNREPDTAGYNDWLGQLTAGASRESILDGFLSSQEFASLCASYGIQV